MRRRAWLPVLALLALGGIGRSDTYWIAWEGDDPNDWPESSGWTRVYNPPGANRTLVDGILTYDSNDPQIYDYYERYRPGALDPQPGSVFVLEWGLWVESVADWGDPGLSVTSDLAWVVNLKYDVDVIHSVHEYVDIPIPPGEWHDYVLLSDSMLAYDLYIDGDLARHGSFAKRFGGSRVGWGDCVQGAASTHHWDYLRFGVVPPPQVADLSTATEASILETLTHLSSG